MLLGYPLLHQERCRFVGRGASLSCCNRYNISNSTYKCSEIFYRPQNIAGDFLNQKRQSRILGLTCSQLDFSSKEQNFLFISLSPSLPPLHVVLHSCSCQVGDAVLGAPHSPGHAGHIPVLLSRAEGCLVALQLS